MNLSTREDLIAQLETILAPLEHRFVPGNAGFHLGETAAHFPPRVAALEGLSRVLWGLAPLVAGGGSSRLTGPLVQGMVNGTDPGHPGYWGIGGDSDQRYVEMAAFSLALLLKPDVFWEPLSALERDHLAKWLGAINTVRLPPQNWEFFRIMVNLALRELGQPYSPVHLTAGLDFVETLYRGDGWYIDETNYDLYNPFAYHFYSLVYVRLFEARDPERCQRFRQRAREFALQYVPWFASDGTMVPHGRSLAYRFAAGSFFSALAFAGEDVLPMGVLKGLVLRHLRWWLDQPIFDHEGLLTIGYGYPNLIAVEQYISPGSPYWSLKTFLVLALDQDHPFWASTELPLPEQPRQKELPVPKMIVCRDGQGPREHVWVLAGGQYPCWESVHSAAKYAKFAYSNRFGFCVSHGAYDLSKTGCDSSLVFSEGDGYWRERRQNVDRSSSADWVHSRWSPWPDVTVETWLVALGQWQVRVHHIDGDRALESVEGGFSLPDSNPDDPGEFPRTVVETRPRPGVLLLEHPWAWGVVADLTPGVPRVAEAHKPEPNLNILHPKVLVPVLRAPLGRGQRWLVTAVAAGMGRTGSIDVLPTVGWEDGGAVVSFGTKRVRLNLA